METAGGRPEPQAEEGSGLGLPFQRLTYIEGETKENPYL
jgi:hypothetical protein